MALRFRVTGHKTERVDLEKSELLREFLEGTAAAFAAHAETAIYRMLREGRWARSTWARYDYYRTWVKHRFGSSRKKGRVNRPDADEPAAAAPDRPEVEWLKLQFLVRRLAQVRQTERRRDGSLRSYLRARVAPGLYQIYDIDQGLARLKGILANTRKKDPKRAREYLRKAAQGFYAAETELNRYLNETRAGQRLLREVQRQVVRLDRDAAAEAARSGEDRRAVLNRMAKRAMAMGGQYRREGRLRPARGHPFGYQTGTLARAWREILVQPVQMRAGSGRVRASFRLTPADIGSGAPDPARLTGILRYGRRNNRDRRPKPALLTRLHRQVIELAVRDLSEDWPLRAKRGRR